MSTPSQIEANRINCLASTGPGTPEGKAVSSRNAISHGLSSTASDPVLPHEDRAEFDALLARYLSDFEPETVHEEFLIVEMAAARWRLNRAARIETIILSGHLEDESPSTGAGPDLNIARSMNARGDALARLERHRAALERTYHRSAREFRAARKFDSEAAAQKAAEKGYREAFQRIVKAPMPPPKPRLQNEPGQHPQPYVRPQPKVGRNDYCPCGSGLKYKKCCLLNAAA